MTPNAGTFEAKVIRDAVSNLFDKIGEDLLVTHSQRGGPGWMIAIKNEKGQSYYCLRTIQRFCAAYRRSTSANQIGWSFLRAERCLVLI